MNFTKALPGDPKRLFPMAKAAIEKAGGKVYGDEQAGEFSGKTPLGKIEGTYRIANGVLRVCLDKKPALIPERKIRDIFDRVCA